MDRFYFVSGSMIGIAFFEQLTAFVAQKLLAARYGPKIKDLD